MPSVVVLPLPKGILKVDGVHVGGLNDSIDRNKMARRRKCELDRRRFPKHYSVPNV